MSTSTYVTIEQYQKMAAEGVFSGDDKRRVELIRGEICEMSPMNLRHIMTISAFNFWCVEMAKQAGFQLLVQCPIRIEGLDSEPEPDFAWIHGQEYAKAPAAADTVLVIEVADTTLSKDRGEKSTLYAESGIQEYWIVNLQAETIEVHREPVGNAYRSVHSFAGDDAIAPLVAPDARLVPGELFATLPRQE